MVMKDPIRTIKVVSYNPSWIDDYKSESEKIYNIMFNEIFNIYHIGSTSIPGIYAKPIIDILIEVRNIHKIDFYDKETGQLGYTPKGEFGLIGRRFFLKGLDNRTNHIHIFQTGDSQISKHLNFRDYMICHPEEAKLYESLKKDLAVEFENDIEGYCNGKDAFIKDIDKKAEEYLFF
jgi:GrpB-like predicted nucleotidyltransferase (UPF0157 family)